VAQAGLYHRQRTCANTGIVISKRYSHVKVPRRAAARPLNQTSYILNPFSRKVKEKAGTQVPIGGGIHAWGGLVIVGGRFLATRSRGTVVPAVGMTL
jgi:hypothetical protein